METPKFTPKPPPGIGWYFIELGKARQPAFFLVLEGVLCASWGSHCESWETLSGEGWTVNHHRLLPH